jgi:RNA polymerase sigma factor (sigma-70 family)
MIDELYRCHRHRVLARIRRYFPGDEADDVLQEVFVRAMAKRHTFRGESAPSTWLHRIALRHCVNRLRDAHRHRRWDGEQGEVLAGRYAAAEQEGRVAFGERWGRLDDELAGIAADYHLRGLSRVDIAARLGCSERTVTNRLEAVRVAFSD